MIAEVRVTRLAAARGGRLLFKDLSFSLKAGEVLALRGANGAGKSTLLRLLAGLVPARSGEIAFIGRPDPVEAEDARAQGLHLLGHRDGLKSSQTVSDELRFWSAWAGGGRRGMEAAAERLLLRPLLNLPVAALSAGQRRRLALARVLAAPRPLWLLDEPLAPLDAGARALFADIMSEHLQGGGLILAATHDALPLAGGQIELEAP